MEKGEKERMKWWEAIAVGATMIFLFIIIPFAIGAGVVYATKAVLGVIGIHQLVADSVAVMLGIGAGITAAAVIFILLLGSPDEGN